MRATSLNRNLGRFNLVTLVTVAALIVFAGTNAFAEGCPVVSYNQDYNLLAGQWYDMGNINVAQNVANMTLTVTYTVDPGFTLTDVHVWISSMTNDPDRPNGRGQYPYTLGNGVCTIAANASGASGATCSLTYSSSNSTLTNYLEWDGKSALYVYAHSSTTGSGSATDLRTGTTTSIDGQTSWGTSSGGECDVVSEGGTVTGSDQVIDNQGNSFDACDDGSKNAWEYYIKFVPYEDCGTGECTETKTDLVAGQNIDAGDLTIAESGVNLVVTYTTTGGWVIDDIHLAVGDSLTDIPTSNKGNPKVGKFEYHLADSNFCASSTDSTQVVCTVPKPMKEDCGWIIAAHAVVSINGGSDTGGQTETAWAGASDSIATETGWAVGTQFPSSGKGGGRGSWASYLDYAECACSF